LLDSLLQETSQKSARMYKHLIVIAAAMAVAWAADCTKDMTTFSTCLASSAQGLGDLSPDGKKDLLARKSCNLIEGLEKCSNAVDASCKDANFSQIWEQSTKAMLGNLEQIPGWDTNKCPAAQRILNGAGSLVFSSFSLFAVVIAQMLRN